MFRTATVLALFATALALPVTANDQPSEPREANKNVQTQPPLTPQQEKILERTGNETRDLGNVPKMSAEEKATDKAAKRVPPTREEQERINKYYPGG